MFDNTFKRNIQDYIRSNHSKIIVEPGQCRFNFRCHNNSVHDAIENEDSEIAMCVYIEDGDPVIHFLNVRDGKYIDNTLGQWSKCMEYYLIELFLKKSFSTQ